MPCRVSIAACCVYGGGGVAAYKATSKSIHAGRCTPGHFHGADPSLLDYFIDGSTRVTGTTANVNVSVGASGTWPGTPWRAQFLVRYRGYIRVQAAGAYTLFVTSSTGGSGGACMGTSESHSPLIDGINSMCVWTVVEARLLASCCVGGCG